MNTFLIRGFPSHCGSVIFHDFISGHKPNTGSFSRNWYKTAFAIFTDLPDQRKAYKYLKKKYKILYQSPILVSPMSGNEYFIVIYLSEKP